MLLRRDQSAVSIYPAAIGIIMKPRENNRRAEERNGSVECGGMIGKVGKVRECPGNGGKVRRHNRGSRVELSANLITCNRNNSEDGGI